MGRADRDPPVGDPDRRRDHEGAEAARRLVLTAFATLLGRLLPGPLGSWLGRRAGQLAWIVLARRRRIALDNAAAAYPTLAPAERRRLAVRSFEHVGLMTVELCRALVEPAARTLSAIDVEGLDHLKRAMSAHGRVVVVSAHLGNWELLSFVHRLTGFPLALVARRLDAAWLDSLVRRLRDGTDVEIIDKRDAVRSIMRALRRGRMVAILLDQNATRREGVFVPFFGRPASTSRSAATFAVRTGTVIVPLFARREPNGRHSVTFHAPLAPPAGVPTDEAIIALTAACTSTIEAAVRRAPEQWLWMHARWRTRPREDRPA